MTVTITITDPTADESRAVIAYLNAVNGGPILSTDDISHTEAPFRVGADGLVSMETANHRITIVDPEQTARRIENATAEECGVPTAEDAGAPDFDSAGLPWDERIHASSRATVADGTWRKKRGVSDELVAEVELELRALTQYEPTEEELNDAAAARGEPFPADPEQEQSAPEVPDAPVQASDTPPPPPAPTANPFLAVMSRIGKSKLDKAKKDELLTAAGALDEKGNPSILVLNKRPELIDGFVALLDSEGV